MRFSYKIIIYSIVCLYFLSCSKEEEFDIQNLNGNKISAFGHSGMGIYSQYPRNSYESLTKALSLGADGVEIDIQLTKDNVLIAFHDNNLSQSTNIAGLVRSLTWDEIKNATYSSPIYTDYSIVSLDQLFNHTKNVHNYYYIFDCKLILNNQDTLGYYNEYIEAIDQLIEKYDLNNNIYIESSESIFLEQAQIKNGSYNLFINSFSFDYGLEVANRLNIFGISISTNNITKRQIETAHSNNKFIVIYDIRLANSNIHAIRKNPDFIQSDNIHDLVKLLNNDYSINQ